MTHSTGGKKKDTGSSFHELMTLLHSEFERIQTKSEKDNERRNLTDILADGINKSLKEIRAGADVYEFKDAAVIHTIVDGAKEGYSGVELRNFINMISSEHHGDPENEYDDEEGIL